MKNVVKLGCRALKGKDSQIMYFEGTIQTDGVGVSIIKQKVDPTRKGACSDC